MLSESTIEYVKAAVEEERERNEQSRALLEAELYEARRSSEQLQQLSSVREELQTHTAVERPVSSYFHVILPISIVHYTKCNFTLTRCSSKN